MIATPLQAREVFHLEFLRGFAKSSPAESFALKGGCNMRFFFGSVRYSEDMDLDAAGVPVHVLQERAVKVLSSAALASSLRTFGIVEVTPQDLARAKQTETVQRFKLRLRNTAGEDLATKIEFSRRGIESPVARECISAALLAEYRMPPIIVPHYTALAAFRQKLRALVGRRQPVARDVFDLFVLGARPEIVGTEASNELTSRDIDEAKSRIYSIDYEEFRDSVLSYLAPDDAHVYESRQTWDEIRLAVVSRIEGGSLHAGR